MLKFEARIWDKAEHWVFDITVMAKDEADARAKVKRMYPPKGFSIRELGHYG